MLILEDVHLIEEAAIHDGLQFFLNHLPPHCHLVFSTRFDPPWSLPRFRARRQMVELRDADLRFISSEATAFLRQSTGDLLTEEEIQLLQARTEGWGVALHLAALALGNHEDHLAYVQRLDGCQRFLLEYMQEEILERQPEALQRFLLQTSLLNRLQADLCRAVTGEPASELLLADLERRHLFLVPLDDARQWYRFHALFRDMLLNRLRKALPEQVAQLHKRAALWYEVQGLLVEAITHAFEARDTAYTVDLLECFLVPRSWCNEYHTLRRWLKRLPAEVLYSRPELTFMFVSTMILSLPHGPETLSQVEEPLSQAERGFRTSLNQAGFATALTLWAILMCFQDDFAGAFTLAHEAIGLFPQDDTRWRGQCLTLLGIEASFAGQQAQASQFLRQGLAICQDASSLPGILFSSAFLGDYYLSQGKLQQAARVFHQVLTTLYAQPDLIKSQLTLESGVREIYHERLICYGLAMCAYEQNDLAEAERLLREALLWGQFSWLHGLTPGLLLQVRLLTALGKAQQANTFLSEMAEQEQSPEVLREISLSQAWLALHMGDLELAQQYAASAALMSESVTLVRREQEMLLVAP